VKRPALSRADREYGTPTWLRVKVMRRGTGCPVGTLAGGPGGRDGRGRVIAPVGKRDTYSDWSVNEVTGRWITRQWRWGRVLGEFSGDSAL
jgi:hypothetical protein